MVEAVADAAVRIEVVAQGVGRLPMQLNILLLATLKIYVAALGEAWRGMILNWRCLVLHLLFLVAFWILAPVALLFGAMAGGFILGLILALLFAAYLATVSAAVQRERVDFREAWGRATELFSPVISVLFILFILNIFAGMALSSPDKLWLRQSLNLIVTVLFNPLPEIIYLSPGVGRGSGTAAFAESFEFIKENFVEWFIPFLVCLSPLLLQDPAGFKSVLIFVFTTSPINILQIFFLTFSGPGILSFGLGALLIIPALYFIFIFRGVLYKELAGTTRRTRIYRARMT